MQRNSLSKGFFALKCLALWAVIFAPSAYAAPSSSYSESPSQPAGYDKALKLIKGENFAEAIPVLHKIEAKARENADVQNLLGFSYRKTQQYDKAATHYTRALTLDPKHKGALEYQGELFLILKDKAAAEANYEKLKKICWLGCTELDDLEKALKNYKS